MRIAVPALRGDEPGWEVVGVVGHGDGRAGALCDFHHQALAGEGRFADVAEGVLRRMIPGARQGDVLGLRTDPHGVPAVKICPIQLHGYIGGARRRRSPKSEVPVPGGIGAV